MKYELVFTQKIDGTYVNHKNVEIPSYNIKVKHNFRGFPDSLKEYLKLDAEITQRVETFKKERDKRLAEKSQKEKDLLTVLKEFNGVIDNIALIQTR